MINPGKLFNDFKSRGINFFTGVPDSLLKDFCAYITEQCDDDSHVITANEGNAVAMAAGHYLGCGRPALVYLQNSGLGNTVNPLLSLNDPDVYGLPVLLLIGWRGEPGVKDEPQHTKQGRITLDLLDAMEVPWHILDEKSVDTGPIVDRVLEQMRENSGPVAILVRKGAFEKYTSSKKIQNDYPLARAKVIKMLVRHLNNNDLVVATTGMPARELYEFRAENGDGHDCDFLTVGSMGHSASIALGLARNQPMRRVICMDGDGSVLMHMGAMAIIAQSGQENIIHVVLNNGAHDSVGGQPTCAFSIDIAGIARACGYRQVMLVSEPDAINAAFNSLLESKGPSLLEVRIRKGARADLGRPKSTPIDNRDALMEKLGVLASQ